MTRFCNKKEKNIDSNRNKEAPIPWSHYEKRRQILTTAGHITRKNKEALEKGNIVA